MCIRDSTTTDNADRYTHMVRTFLMQQLPRFPEINFLQQDGATSHTARVSMAALRELFPDGLISRYGDISCPARSPDLSACNFFLWGFLKSRVYIDRPHTIPELKTNIGQEIARIQSDLLRRVTENFWSRLEECLHRNGSHLSGVILKK